MFLYTYVNGSMLTLTLVMFTKLVSSILRVGSSQPQHNNWFTFSFLPSSHLFCFCSLLFCPYLSPTFPPPPQQQNQTMCITWRHYDSYGSNLAYINITSGWWFFRGTQKVFHNKAFPKLKHIIQSYTSRVS